jgi:DNA-binding FadR family transcriptional regulator
MSYIKRLSLQSEIIQYIKQYIDSNSLKSGDRLPSQAEFMELLGVSRSSIREAIKTLEAKDILEVENGKGIFVKDASTNTISAQIELGKEKETILELLEARKILEREIIHLVIQNATEEELDEIEKILKIIMEKYNRGEKQNVEDRQFHLAIYNSCHNRIMNQLILSIDSLLQKLFEFPLGMEDPFTETMPLHQELFDCIRKRNVKGAQSSNDRIINMMYKDIKSVK